LIDLINLIKTTSFEMSIIPNPFNIGVPGTRKHKEAVFSCQARICESGPKDGSGSGPRSGLTAMPCRQCA